jgi:hypothetical protein
MNLHDKVLGWLDKHRWFLDHHRLTVDAASYVYKCGYLAGLDAGQTQMMNRLVELTSDAKSTQGDAN